MSVEDNKALARRFREAMDRRESPDEYLAPACIAHFPGIPPLDREQVTGMIGAFYSAFPDLRHTLEDQVAEGDKVVTRITLRGTHRGDFQGIPPTGKQIEFTGVVTDCIRESKIVEHWGLLDMLTLLQQLGAVPTPQQSGA